MSTVSTKDQINNIQDEITQLKKIFDIITENNLVIDKYVKYQDYSLNSVIYQEIQKLEKDKPHQIIQYLDLIYGINQLSINLLVPNFIDVFITNCNLKDNKNIQTILEEHFSNHKLVEGISNALYLQKSNEKIILKYGTLLDINKKLTSMFYKKIELLHIINLDDI
jgi:hypothetical protein